MSASWLLFLVALDGLAGYACIRKRKVAHALWLGAVAVPCGLVMAAVTFGAYDAGAGLSPDRALSFLALGFGGLGLSILAVVWLTAAALLPGGDGHLGSGYQ